MEFRKRAPGNQTDHQVLSGRLRAVATEWGKGRFADALSALDTLSGGADLTADRKCQIASLAGQVLLAQGRFAAAAETFQKAWQLGKQTPEAWFGAALGRVLAQLRNVDAAAALVTGKKALAQAVNAREHFAGLAAAAPQALAQTGSVRVDRAPIRASVAAFRLGQQFWDEGEPETAAWFFAEARRLEPDGACRARIALARVALGNEDFQGAYAGAKGALLQGQFHAKTFPAWPVLIAAARKLGRSGVESALVNGLAQATPTVRGRARLVIAKELRAYGDPAWKDFAVVQPGDGDILAAEFRKLNSADSGSLAAAEQLLATPNLGPSEWLGAAKAVVARRLAAKADPALAATLADGLARHGADSREAFRHGLALACVQAKRPDLALTLLPGNTDVKSAWLRARLLRDAGDLAASAAGFQAIATRADSPERFRLLAGVEAMRCLVLAGDEQALAEAAPQVLAAAQNIRDYVLLLDLARQMTQAPAELADHAGEVFARGEALAKVGFAAAEQPAVALEILFKLTRRQCDFGRYAAIVQAWEQLPERTRDWLWTRDGLYWQYLGLVTTAYRARNRIAEADALSEKYLEDAATPPNGLAELGIPHALSLITRDNTASAFDWLDWLAWQAPTYPLCAYAHYWLALRAEKSGDTARRDACLQALALALGSSLGMSWKQALDAKRRLLAGATPGQIAGATRYLPDFLQRQAEELQTDRARL